MKRKKNLDISELLYNYVIKGIILRYFSNTFGQHNQIIVNLSFITFAELDILH